MCQVFDMMGLKFTRRKQTRRSALLPWDGQAHAHANATDPRRRHHHQVRCAGTCAVVGLALVASKGIEKGRAKGSDRARGSRERAACLCLMLSFCCFRCSRLAGQVVRSSPRARAPAAAPPLWFHHDSSRATSLLHPCVSI
jgi:hypothetical protein